MKVVFDTMIWVSYCTFKDGYRYRLIDRARRQRARIYVSEYILKELRETLTEDLARSRRYAMLARQAILRIAKMVALPQVIPSYVPGDANDDPIVQTALSAKADYLVTADAEILAVGKVRDLIILTPQQFDSYLVNELGNGRPRK